MLNSVAEGPVSGQPRAWQAYARVKSRGVGVQPVENDDPGSELPAHASLSAPAGDIGSRDGEVVAHDETRRATLARQFSGLIEAIQKDDEDAVQTLVLDLSRRNRILAPLALVVGAIDLLFDGVKLLFTNWRLTLVQVLPAMWIWVAMIDLKAHVLHGKSFHVIRGPIVLPIILAIATITAASFFLNAVFAFAISKQGKPEIRPAFTEARRHHRTVLSSGGAIGVLLGLSTVVVVRWGELWFTISLGMVIAIMMVCYVAIPSRLIGTKSTAPRGDKLKTAAVGGFLGAVVCSPPYLLGRIGLLMLGSHTLFFLGVVFLSVGLVLEAGATSAVKAVKMSAKLVAGQPVAASESEPGLPGTRRDSCEVE
jgi:uncharacterized membrane protein